MGCYSLGISHKNTKESMYLLFSVFIVLTETRVMLSFSELLVMLLDQKLFLS